MYYVYLLQLSNGNIYTGSTSDLRARIKQHESGQTKSIKPFLPVRLIHYEAYTLKSDALRRETYLKTSEGKKFLKQQIRDYLEKRYKGR